MSDRTVSTDALATLGTIIDEHQKRDAIHIAVIPMQAGIDLYPGSRACVIDGKAYREGAKHVGVVDPFLDNRGQWSYAHVKKDEWFWLLLYPRQITSLRHVWSHPDFPHEGDKWEAPTINKEASEAWLREFCAKADCPSYEVVMGAIQGTMEKNDEDYGVSYRYGDEYLHFNGHDAHAAIPPVFWDHVESVLGHKVAHRPEYFSCSC